MNTWRAVVFAASTFCMAPPSVAAELQIIAGGGIAAPLNEIAAQFEKATGHKLVIRYGTTPQLVKMTFAAALTEVARVGIGVAVRAGAPKPDISTPDALKKTLLDAKSVASIPESATGYLLTSIYERLGIGEAMKAKTRPQPTPAAIAQSVASGENELAVFLTNVITAPGVDVVGPFPPEVQMELVYTTGLSAATKQAEAATAFIAYLRSPAATAVIKAKGMRPSS